MRIPPMPRVLVSGDKFWTGGTHKAGEHASGAAGIMSSQGQIMGITRSRAVWRFGFMQGSALANALGCHTVEPLWVIADHKGVVKEEWSGFAVNLPERFARIIEGYFA